MKRFPPAARPCRHPDHGPGPGHHRTGAHPLSPGHRGPIPGQPFYRTLTSLGLPIGLRESDHFFQALAALAGTDLPEPHARERGRRVDAFVDGHKYVFGKKAVVYGEEDLVVGLTSFLAEIGIHPVLCASGGSSGHFAEAIAAVTADLLPEPPVVKEGMDFYEIAAEVEALAPDLLIGQSKGYHLAKKFGLPLIRVGFPIHDRFGAKGPCTWATAAPSTCWT